MPKSGETWGAEDVESWETSFDANTSGRGFLVKLHTTEGQIALATAGTDVVYGVIVQNAADTATSGRTVAVVPLSSGKTAMVKVLAAGTNIAIGDTIGASTGGKGAKNTTDGQYVVGRATSAAAADNVFIPVAFGTPQQRAS